MPTYVEIPTRVADVDTNAAADMNQIMDNIKTFAGNIHAFGNNSVPSGFLLCDGSVVSQATYATLFAAIGTTWDTGGEGAGNFRLPDLEGVFLRGTGNQDISARTKTGPSVGAAQEDAAQGHRHNVSPLYGSAAGGDSVLIIDTSGTEVFAAKALDPVTDTVNGTPRTDDETYPSSYGVKYVIKY